MSGFMPVLATYLGLQAWILVGFLVLVRAVGGVASRPQTFLHALVWMLLWPLLLLRMLRVTLLNSARARAAHDPTSVSSLHPR